MKNIMKSILYEVLHSKLLIRIYLLFILVQAFIGILNLDAFHPEQPTVSNMLADGGYIAYEFPLFVLALIVGTMVGEDYRDKVANYEVMSGHSRKSIFLARSLMATFIAAFACSVLAFIPMLAGSVFADWGNTLVLKDVVIRYLLMFFPFLRLAAFLTVLTFIIKNNYLVMAVGFGMMFVNSMLSEMLKNNENFFISMFNLKLLTCFDGWNIYNVDPQSGVVYYNSFISSVSPKLVIGTIAVSLLMTAFYLFMGYALFRRDDLN